MTDPNCPYCRAEEETVLWRDDVCRAVLVDEPGFPGWCRVIWHEHVREFSDLAENQRAGLIEVVAQTERMLRDLLKPAKVNLAALGTQAPHLHWHVIPRFEGDPTFPAPAWSARRPLSLAPDLPDGFVDSAKARLGDLLGGKR